MPESKAECSPELLAFGWRDSEKVSIPHRTRGVHVAAFFTPAISSRPARIEILPRRPRLHSGPEPLGDAISHGFERQRSSRNAVVHRNDMRALARSSPECSTLYLHSVVRSSAPAFSAIWRAGDSSARRTI
jgi:hypothetical protein